MMHADIYNSFKCVCDYNILEEGIILQSLLISNMRLLFQFIISSWRLGFNSRLSPTKD